MLFNYEILASILSCSIHIFVIYT